MINFSSETTNVNPGSIGTVTLLIFQLFPITFNYISSMSSKTSEIYALCSTTVPKPLKKRSPMGIVRNLGGQFCMGAIMEDDISRKIV